MEAASPSPGQQPRDASTVDAMGQDKRRQVVGHSYGPSKQRQLAYYGIFLAFVVAAYFAFQFAVDQLDKAPSESPDKAPWSKPNAPGDPSGRGFFAPEDHSGVTRFQ